MTTTSAVQTTTMGNKTSRSMGTVILLLVVGNIAAACDRCIINIITELDSWQRIIGQRQFVSCNSDFAGQSECHPHTGHQKRGEAAAYLNAVYTQQQQRQCVHVRNHQLAWIYPTSTHIQLSFSFLCPVSLCGWKDFFAAVIVARAYVICLLSNLSLSLSLGLLPAS